MIRPNQAAAEASDSGAVMLPRRSFALALLSIVPGMMMVMLDSTAMNVAIPSLTQDFQVSFETLQWIITGYMLAMSVTIPLAGWFSDRVGAARAFIVTLILFIIGSLLCSLAQSADQLIIFRVIQGLGGGMIQPIGMAMVYQLAPPHKKGQIMGMLGIPMLLAPASGPILSGWLLESAGWQWIFLINLPIGLFAVGIGVRYLLQVTSLGSPRTAPQSLDGLGLALAPISFVLLALSMNQSGGHWRAWLMGAVGILLLIWLCIHELRHSHPILELRAFRSFRFRRGIIVSWIQYMALNGSLVFIPQYLQQFRSFSPLQAGWIMSMLALTSGLIMPIGGRIYDRTGIRPLTISGLGTIAVALFLLSRVNSDMTELGIAGMVALLGLGMGLCMMSLNTYILQSVPTEMISRVTPLTSASANLIIPLAIAGLSNFLTIRTAARITEGNVAPQAMAEMAAYSDTFLLAACIALGGALFSMLLTKQVPQSNKGEG